MSRAARLAALLLAAPMSWACADAAPDARSDVVLITIDTLRPDHLGHAGYPRDTSPAIDRLATASLRFERAYSHGPVTRIGVASLLTGLLPHETGILDAPALPAGVDTLAERLRSHGYRTAAVIGNYVLRAGRGFEQGFELYDDRMSDFEAVRRWPERIAEHTTDRAIEVLREDDARPLFLWVHYQDPHGPYTPPPAAAARFRSDGEVAGAAGPLPLNDSLSGRGGVPAYQQVLAGRDRADYVARYDGEIRHLDDHLQRLIATLQAQGRWDEALIVLTSDHGEGMGEHDYWFAHGEYLYEHQLRVPLLVRHGPELAGARRDLARGVDVAATILAAAGLPADPRVRGRDLRAAPAADADELELFAAMQSPLVEDGEGFALRRGDHKLIVTPASGRSELYDLGVDPGETTDLAGAPDHAPRRAELASALARLLAAERVRPGPGDAPGLTPEERLHLKALGYLED